MRLPSFFFSHGSPALVLDKGAWATTLGDIGQRLKELKPELIVVVSAHWLTKGIYLECSEKMKTIHDFYGFSKELYDLEYPASGNPKLAGEIAQEVGGRCVKGRGLDHGAWTLLWHLFPKADISVTQMSLDVGRSLKEHFEVGERLRKFRDRVLIISSGGAVHNLRDAILNPGEPPEWAVRFKGFLKKWVLKKDINSLLNYRDELGRLAHPTEEHLVPLFYFLGSLYPEEAVEVLYDSFEFGSVSLLSFSSR